MSNIDGRARTQIHAEFTTKDSRFPRKGLKAKRSRESRRTCRRPDFGVHDQFGCLSSNQTENLADKYAKQLCKRMSTLSAASPSHVAILTSSLLSFFLPMFVALTREMSFSNQEQTRDCLASTLRSAARITSFEVIFHR